MTAYPVWHRTIYSCTHATVGVSCCCAELTAWKWCWLRAHCDGGYSDCGEVWRPVSVDVDPLAARGLRRRLLRVCRAWTRNRHRPLTDLIYPSAATYTLGQPRPLPEDDLVDSIYWHQTTRAVTHRRAVSTASTVFNDHRQLNAAVTPVQTRLPRRLHRLPSTPNLSPTRYESRTWRSNYSSDVNFEVIGTVQFSSLQYTFVERIHQCL